MVNRLSKIDVLNEWKNVSDDVIKLTNYIAQKVSENLKNNNKTFVGAIGRVICKVQEELEKKLDIML